VDRTERLGFGIAIAGASLGVLAGFLVFLRVIRAAGGMGPTRELLAGFAGMVAAFLVFGGCTALAVSLASRLRRRRL
jgi:hypothetical protein